MKVALIVVLALCAVSALAVRRQYDLDENPKVLFKQWLQDYPMTFSSLKEERERLAIFTDNIQRIRDLNEKHKGRTSFMLNKFAHLSEEEFKDTYLSTKMPNSLKYKPGAPLMRFSEETIKALPTEVDWRTHNPPVVTPVKDQRACGSCWAFSTTGNVEGQWALAGNQLVSLSEQNLVDCDHECVAGVCDAGCNGGLMENAFEYIIKNDGIDSETVYPYEARDGPCRFKRDGVAAKISNYTFIESDPDQMAAFVANKGPLAIAADASLWQFYYGGVWYVYCGTHLNHGIMIVGYGVEQDILGREMPYWIIKNSWGADWGEDGYILVEKGNNRCLVQDYPITSIV